MTAFLKPKETSKTTPEAIEQAVPAQEVQSPPQEAKEPHVDEEPKADQSQEQPHGTRLVSVSQHIRPLEERVATPETKSERLIEIEKIMSKNLEDIYAALPVEVQAAVKYEGEIAAAKIESLIESGREISKKVLAVLRAWLQKIPGVNVFFLEQESKRKTDKIMAIACKSRPDAHVA